MTQAQSGMYLQLHLNVQETGGKDDKEKGKALVRSSAKRRSSLCCSNTVYEHVRNCDCFAFYSVVPSSTMLPNDPSLTLVVFINPFNPDSAKSKSINFPKLQTGDHSKVLLNSVPMNGHTLVFCV